MAATVRAKFRCANRTTTQYGPTEQHAYVEFEFQALYDDSVPEDRRYAKATPIGKLTIRVDNPAVSFEPGKAYYLDITAAD